jgi:hypothetical protein
VDYRPAVPTDPTIYRFYEALQVYGGAIKELIHEQFGDGIMSAINFSMTLEKKPHPPAIASSSHSTANSCPTTGLRRSPEGTQQPHSSARQCGPVQDRHEPRRGPRPARPFFSRRRALQLAGVAGVSVLVAACSTSTDKKATGTTTTLTAKSTDASGGAADTACAKTTPAETAGPFPADGSNGPNVLGEDGVVRIDIRTSFGVLSGWAEGVQTTIERQELSSRRSGRRPGRPRVLHLGLPGLRERSMATHQRRGVRLGRIGRCR